mgnify:CR=1 FL=1
MRDTAASLSEKPLPMPPHAHENVPHGESRRGAWGNGGMGMSLRFRVIFASACAVLVVMLVVGYADTVRAAALQEHNDAVARYGGDVASVVVATTALEPGDVVEASDVGMRDWIADLVPEGACTSLDAVVGREVTSPIPKNAVVADASFRTDEAMAQVPSGMVAITLPITDRLGVQRGIPVGTRLTAYQVDKESARLLAEGLMVLSAPSGPSASGIATSATQAQLTVAAPSDGVDALLAASAAGTLKFVLPADDAAPPGSGATSKDARAPEPVEGASEATADTPSIQSHATVELGSTE